MRAIQKKPAVSQVSGSRRKQVLDGAIEVLARAGPRGLTYRAIDRFLETPEGSTSNYFGRRLDILEAVADRIFKADIERLGMVILPAEDERITADWVAERLVDYWSERPPSWIIARYHIAFEAVRHPKLNKIIRQHGVEIQKIWNEVFRRLGAHRLFHSAVPWVDIIRGLLFTQVMLSDRMMPRRALVSLLKDEIVMLLKRE
jgi:AcrR family transcriptional regulator